LNKGLKILLLPVAFLYGLITLLRNRLYDWKILREKEFEIHTIGVGNLSVGGAGKTPLVEYLIRLLQSEALQPATLSRGYKRKTKGFILANDTSTSDDIGDEPLIYKTKYTVPVAVDANRRRGIQTLAQLEKPPAVILLDDVFQHRAVRCGLTIVVSDFNHLYFKDQMMPAGTLREFPSGIQRADVIIISKTPEFTSAVNIRTILKDISPRAHQQVFFSYLKYGDLYSVHDKSQTMDTLNDLFRYRCILFSGIAKPAPMITYLKEYAADVRHLGFPDHHDFSEKDLVDIERYYHSFAGGNNILVTTEKDLMRLKKEPLWSMVRTMNIYVLPVEVTFKEKEEEFNSLILKYVRSNRIHHHKYT
jgi:tetraacyldisaccharide 4'-kinase